MDFRDRIHPERQVAGFSALDGTLRFYNFVQAAIRQSEARRILDFGAGRGAPFDTETGWMRQVLDLRQSGAEVWAADVDPVVEEHPASDHRVILTPGEKLPFADAFFDVVVSDWTFEHIQQPEAIANELLRVTRPGGYICARTVNAYSYLKLASSLLPNRLHSKALGSIQPDRKEIDVFPTVYKMNSVARIRALFPNCTIGWYRDSADPSYFFGSKVVYRAFLALHRLLPNSLAVTICFFIRKND